MLGQQQLNHGVAGLVIGRGQAVFLVDDATLAGPAPADLVAGFLEIFHLDEILVFHCGNQCRFVDHRGQVGPAEARRGPGRSLQVHIGAELHFMGVNLQNLEAAFDVGRGNVHLPIKSAGADQGWIQHVRAVGGCDDDDLVIGLKTVHLDEDRIQRLLALVMAARAEARPTPTPNSVDLVQEDDAGRVFLRGLEQVADPRGAHADEHLDEIAAADRIKGHIGFAGDGLCQQCLAAARLPDEQDAARNSASDALELARVAQKLDDLGDFFLGFVDAGHVIERDVGVLFAGQAMARAAEVAQHAGGTAPGPHRAKNQEPKQRHQHYPGQQVYQDGYQQSAAGLVLPLAAACGEVLLQTAQQLFIVHRVGPLDAELRVGADLIADEFASTFHGVVPQCDALDLSRFQFLVELADGHRLLGVHILGQQHQQHENEADDDHPAENAARHLHARLGLARIAAGVVGTVGLVGFRHSGASIPPALTLSAGKTR